MKLQVTQENLAKALNTVARIANTRGTLPVLSNVILKTVGTRLSIAATNLDIAITHFVGSKISKQGAITVPARLMQDFISSLPGGVIDLVLDDYKLNISTDKYKSTINGVSAEEFPVMPALEKGDSLTLDAKALKSSLSQVVLAASADEARPVLTGVYLHSFEKALYLVATDSYRLAEKKLGKTEQEVELLVPASAMNELLRVLPEDQDTVQVTYNNQQVSFKVGDVELVTRLIEGSYPDYRKLIPRGFTTQATLKTADFTNIAKVSSLFARETAGSITISASPAEELISIHSVASQLGENTASATATVKGDGDITLNSRYLLDALGAVGSPEVRVSFNGKLEPCVLADPGSKEYLHVIMPLKS